MEHQLCHVKIGLHIGPFWFDKNSGLVVCTRHRREYEESVDEYGPFDWEEARYWCEWAGGMLKCDEEVKGFVGEKNLAEHPLCWKHLNPDQHPPNQRDDIHPLEEIISPCEHAKIRNEKNQE